jgi:hypothetical protein
MKRHFLSLMALATLLLSVHAGCGAATARPAGLDPNRLIPRNLYPMQDGYVWSYNVDTGTGMNTFAVSRVVSVEGSQIAISNGGDELLYELREGGIFRPQTGTWLLKAPIDVGATWESSGGLVARVVSVTEHVSVPAGEYDGCVEVIEEGGDSGRRIRTIYCAGVGPTVIESTQTLQLRDEPLVVRGQLMGLVRGAEDAEEPEGYEGP